MATETSFPTSHRTIKIDGLNIFYREAGDARAPALVLLHGFPASSHQYRNLIPALADRFHVIAMDYPGFGNSDMPDPEKHPYTFDRTSEVVEAFLQKKEVTSFGLFAQDYGGPTGATSSSAAPTQCGSKARTPPGLVRPVAGSARAGGELDAGNGVLIDLE
jgi:pimeloyl-ACP methyl ester carboxylesterase